mmetsp:Transcript_23150/g.38091  ORF Transcript_23150/g.38091 Transcript_23150/m.38091 type:complete len:211 (-) Transcript_23150:259-891(-)
MFATCSVGKDAKGWPLEDKPNEIAAWTKHKSEDKAALVLSTYFILAAQLKYYDVSQTLQYERDDSTSPPNTTDCKFVLKDVAGVLLPRQSPLTCTVRFLYKGEVLQIKKPFNTLAFAGDGGKWRSLWLNEGEVRHRCGHHPCHHPGHLEVVSHDDNMKREGHFKSGVCTTVDGVSIHGQHGICFLPGTPLMFGGCMFQRRTWTRAQEWMQ